MRYRYAVVRNTLAQLTLAAFFPMAILAQPAVKGEITSADTSPKGYEITGYIKGLEEGEKVMALLLSPPTWNKERRDSGYVKNGVFHLSGFVPEGPREYLVAFSRNMTAFDLHEYRLINLTINNGEKITLKCDTDIAKINRGIIDDFVYREGALYDRSMRSLFSGWYFYIKAIADLKGNAQRLVDSVGFDGPVLTAIFESIDAVNRSFWSEIFNARPSQLNYELSIAYLSYSDGLSRTSGHASFLAEQYNQLSEQEKNSYYGKRLGEYARLCVGKPMSDFSLPNSEGKLLALKDVVQKGKVTLVNFWGTNSPLVKACHAELKDVYKKFHNKGLNIIAVSSDDYKEVWEDAVGNGNYPWYNVLDKKGYMVDSVYHEYGTNLEKLRNVTNVLLDANGKIIAWDVIGVELQWYLWKYLENIK